MTLMKFLSRVLAISFACVIFWAKPVFAEDIRLGKQLFDKQCASCHGATGLGNDALGAPALAEQLSSYTLRQLTDYQEGFRGHQDQYSEQMSAITKSIGVELDYPSIALYLESLNNLARYKYDGDKSAGYKQYQSSCGGCHGGQAEGNVALNSPRLAGLSPDYLTRQYGFFMTGKRGTSKHNRFGRQMAMIANTLRDEEKIRNVVAYINSLQQAR